MAAWQMIVAELIKIYKYKRPTFTFTYASKYFIALVRVLIKMSVSGMGIVASY
jgi:hypothetical protein